jgi:dipeptidyl aminopeptidase/acylaminoacyl peptidase
MKAMESSVSRVLRRLRCPPIGLLCLSVMMIVPAAAGQIPGPKRKVTVEDTVTMTRWADQGYFAGGDPDGPVGIFSPDKTRFVVVVETGNIENNTNVYALLLFLTKDVFRSPPPQVVLSMSSSSNRDAISNVKWLEDNETITFLGEDPGQIPEVYSLNTRSRELKKLTTHATAVVAYDISRDGRTIVYKADPQPVPILDTTQTRRTGVVVNSQYPNDLLLADCKPDQTIDASKKRLFLQIASGTEYEIPTSDVTFWYQPLSISPNGQFALIASFSDEIPVAWSEYEDKLLHPYIIEQRKAGHWSNVEHYMLLDTANHKLTPLLDAPLWWANRGFAWVDDGASVLISGTLLPLSLSDSAERKRRLLHSFVAEVSLPGKRVTSITDEEMKIASWDNRSRTLTLRSQKGTRETYQQTGSEWKRVPLEPEVSDESVRVTLEEDANTPPKVFVSRPNEAKPVLLFDLNPQFAQLQFGRVESVTWNATDGHAVEGGLYLPPDYQPGQLYPLVIQTHGFDEHRFWIDGPWSGAFAAQPLAARGFIVLQVGAAKDRAEDRNYAGTPEEGARRMAVYEGAIDYLFNRGLIDKRRVGIVGFSRTVFHVGYALTHSKYSFAAATLADGFDGGYVNYILWGISDYAAVNGGEAAGPNLSSWLKNSPGFNLDKVNAPVRLETYDFAGILGSWQWFSGLSLLNKPVDFIWLPFGTHLLVKPWERMASQQGNVDWFSFWLEDREDADALKEPQYRRWRMLKKLESQE